MFETYSSRAHQSAVERLIQLATGKKAPAQVEEEPAAPVTVEPPNEQVEVAAEQPAVEQAPEQPAENAESEAPASEAAAVVESLAAEAEQVEEEKPRKWPLHQPPVEQHQNETAPVEFVSEVQAAVEELAPEVVAEPVQSDATSSVVEPTDEALAEPTGEPANDTVRETMAEPMWHEHSEFEHSVGPVSLDVSAVLEAQTESSTVASHVEEEAEEEHSFHSFHEEFMESALVESVLAEHDGHVADEHAEHSEYSEDVVTEQPAEVMHEQEVPAVAQAEDPAPVAASESAVVEETEQLLHEMPIEVQVEEALAGASAEAETAAMEEPVAEAVPEPADEEAAAAKTAAAEIEANIVKEVETGETANHKEPVTNEAAYAAVRDGEESDEPFKLGNYLHQTADQKPEESADSANVVPLPDETTYLRAKHLGEHPSEGEFKELTRDPMWKTLMQFKGWLPLVTRVLPLLDLASNRANQVSSPASAEMKETIHGLEVAHKDLRVTLQDHTLELKRVEEEVSKLRDAADKTAFEQAVMVDEMKSMHRLLKNAFLYVGILLGLLVVAVGYMGFLVFTYLNHPIH